jgi:hypothetical protein
MALNTDKFAKIMAMMSSDQDGETLAALRRAQAMLTEEKMSFLVLDVADWFAQPKLAKAVAQSTARPARRTSSPLNISGSSRKIDLLGQARQSRPAAIQCGRI